MPFLFDDGPAIVANRSIRHLGRLATVLWPSGTDGSGVAGRPLVNLSLALNYAWGGLDPAGYHVFNLAVHLLAALALFGVVRRTLERRGDPAPLALAFSSALLWTVHPLLTETVTCVVQRTESLVALCYLFSLYAFIRGWRRTSVLACLCGMAAKEVMVTAPLVVLLYDRTFCSGSFREAWRARRGYYTALFATWLPLALLVMAGGGQRGSAAGFGLGVPWWAYALTQARAVCLYLKLAFWPHPLVVDYGWAVVTRPGAVAWQLLALGFLLAATGWGLAGPRLSSVRWALANQRAAGFLGACFFLILAPSSSVVPLVTQTVAEHRMYLPLAALAVLAAAALRAAAGRAALALSVAAALGLGGATFARNAVYRTGLSLWRDTVAKCPGNPRALNNLALELAKQPGGAAEAERCDEAALQADPAYAEAHSNLALLLDAEGRTDEALLHFQRALALRPRYPEALEGLGIALSRAGRTAEATAVFARGVALDPDSAKAHFNYAVDLAALPGRRPDSIREYAAALRADPDDPAAHYNLANLLAETPATLGDAIAHYEAALRLRPDDAPARNNLALAYARIGRVDLAVRQLEAALRIDPRFGEARHNLAALMAR